MIHALPAHHHSGATGSTAPVFADRAGEAAMHIRSILDAAPFNGCGRLVGVHDGLRACSYSTVVCVPARDEAERLPASLDSISVALDALDAPGAIVVAVNNSTDATFGLARRWAEVNDRPLLACDVGFDVAIADAGHARRLALDVGATVAGPGAVLLSTDADTRVEPDWATRLSAAVRKGAGIVVGQIDTDADEFAAMPNAVREAEAAERRLLARQDALWSRLVPQTPQVLGLRAGGANLAIDAGAYRRIGGAPTPSFGEDRALVAAMARADETILIDRTRTIQTSCRLEARAEYGMGGMLKSRLADPDPLTDEVLMPARDFALRALAWRHLLEARRTWRVAEMIRGVEALAGALRVPPVALFPVARTQGSDWERLAARLKAPARLRVGQLSNEVERADRILANTTADASTERLVEEILSC